MIKSDNIKEVGQHAFEVAGLGKAPFRCVGFEYRVGPIQLDNGSQVGSPGQPMGTCDFCSNGIADCFVIKSSDNKRSIVGCNCVERTDDSGLIKGYKKRPEYREHKRKQRHAREQRKIDEIPSLIELHRESLVVMPHPVQYRSDQGHSFFDYAEWTMQNAGNSGKCKLHRELNKMEIATPESLHTSKQVMEHKKLQIAIAADDLKAREVAENAARLVQASANKQRNADLISVLCGQTGDFCRDIGKRLENESVADMSPRIVEILQDIYAKHHGRRNSKKYDKAYDAFESLFVS